MSQTATMTETTAPQPQQQQKKQTIGMFNLGLFAIDAKNDTLYEIKKLATGLHYLSLCALGLLYFVEHEWTRNACILTALFFVLAMFIPPTGMIKQEDAPAAAHKSMSYMPEKGFEDPSADGDDAASADAAKGPEKKTKKKGGNNKKKNK